MRNSFSISAYTVTVISPQSRHWHTACFSIKRAKSSLILHAPNVPSIPHRQTRLCKSTQTSIPRLRHHLKQFPLNCFHLKSICPSTRNRCLAHGSPFFMEEMYNPHLILHSRCHDMWRSFHNHQNRSLHSPTHSHTPGH